MLLTLLEADRWSDGRAPFAFTPTDSYRELGAASPALEASPQDSVASAPVQATPIAEREPAADDPVDRPDARAKPHGERDRDAHERDEQDAADEPPERGEPERADQPAEVRLEEGAARLVPLHVVDDHGDDGRQSEHA